MTDYTNLGSEDTREKLNAMTLAEVTAMLKAPKEHVRYATADGWNVGDERPALASDDPAVMQAIGRCAVTRRTNVKGTSFEILTSVHPSPCGWCGYPTDELLKACAWAVHQSGYVEAHTFEWRDSEKRLYLRAGGDTGFRNPVHRRFWELPPKERERRIEAAAGRTQA